MTSRRHSEGQRPFSRVQMSGPDFTPAFAYLSRNRQSREHAAIQAFAADSKHELVAEFSGNFLDDIEKKSGFATLLKRIEVTGVSTVIVASAHSLSDGAHVHAVAQAKLAQFGITLITADMSKPDITAERLATRVLDLAATLDAAMRSAHLRATGERSRTKLGPKRRRTYAEMCPEVVATAKRLYREQLKTGRPFSLREIGARLAQNGFVTRTGPPYHPEAVKRMIKGPRGQLANADHSR